MFGNIFVRKRRVLARLRGIQRLLAHGDNLYSQKLEKDLHDEYNHVLS